MNMNWVKQADSRAKIRVRILPRAGRNEIVGIHGDAIKIKLAAPPVEGAANAALVEFLCDTLHIPRARIRIVTGAKSRSKCVEILDINPEIIATVLLPESGHQSK